MSMFGFIGDGDHGPRCTDDWVRAGLSAPCHELFESPRAVLSDESLWPDHICEDVLLHWRLRITGSHFYNYAAVPIGARSLVHYLTHPAVEPFREREVMLVTARGISTEIEAYAVIQVEASPLQSAVVYFPVVLGEAQWIPSEELASYKDIPMDVRDDFSWVDFAHLYSPRVPVRTGAAGVPYVQANFSGQPPRWMNQLSSDSASWWAWFNRYRSPTKFGRKRVIEKYDLSRESLSSILDRFFIDRRRQFPNLPSPHIEDLVTHLEEIGMPMSRRTLFDVMNELNVSFTPPPDI